MKPKILSVLFVLITITFSACGNNSNGTGTKNNQSTVAETTAVAKPAIDTTPATQETVTIKDIIAAYLQLKNAFTKDNSNDAATAGKSLLAAFTNFDTKTLPAEQAKSFNDIADDAKEHSEHIGANSSNIKHQREHFVMLSKDIADFVKTFGNGGQTLYKDFCPMANDSKGAIWISEVKEIKNPYLGKAMPTCGSVKETIQ